MKLTSVTNAARDGMLRATSLGELCGERQDVKHYTNNFCAGGKPNRPWPCDLRLFNKLCFSGP